MPRNVSPMPLGDLAATVRHTVGLASFSQTQALFRSFALIGKTMGRRDARLLFVGIDDLRSLGRDVDRRRLRHHIENANCYARARHIAGTPQ